MAYHHASSRWGWKYGNSPHGFSPRCHGISPRETMPRNYPTLPTRSFLQTWRLARLRRQIWFPAAWHLDTSPVITLRLATRNLATLRLATLRPAKWDLATWKRATQDLAKLRLHNMAALRTGILQRGASPHGFSPRYVSQHVISPRDNSHQGILPSGAPQHGSSQQRITTCENTQLRHRKKKNRSRP